MKQYLVIIVSLALIVNSNCGLIDGFIGTVTDTTSSITQHVGGVLRHGKNFVFGGSERNAAGEVVNKPGIVGTISLKIHDVSQAVREEVRTVIHLFDGDQIHGKGIIGRLIDKVKSRVFKINSFLSGGSHTQIKYRPYVPIKKLDNDTAVLCQKLNKYFFKNDGSANTGIKQTLYSLQDALNRIRLNITKKREESNNGNSEQDGSGLIDIRTSVNNIPGGLQNDFENGIDVSYDKVNEIDEGLGAVESSINDAKRNTNNFIENQRRNVQNHYNQFSNNANRLRSDIGNSFNDNIETQRRNVQNHYNQLGNTAIKFKGDVVNSIENVGIRLSDEADKVKVNFESQGNLGRRN